MSDHELLAQQKQWLDDVFPVALNPGRSNIVAVYELPVDVRIELLRSAVQELWRAQDALRAYFVRSPTGWAQRFTEPDAAVPYREIDLAGFDGESQGRLSRRLAVELDATLNIEHGPLARFVLFRFGGERPPRLLVIVHHIVSDAVSMNIIRVNIERAYAWHEGKNAGRPPMRSSYRECLAKLNDYVRSDELRSEIEYWTTRPWEELATLPHRELPDSAPPLYCLDDVTRSISLGPLRDAEIGARPGGFGISDVVLGSISWVFTSWANGPLPVAMAHNGRSIERRSGPSHDGHGPGRLVLPLSVMNTVGFFSVLSVVFLPHGGSGPDVEYLRDFVACLEAAPNSGAGYGLLLYLGAPDVLRERVEVPGLRGEFSLNYMKNWQEGNAGGTGLLSGMPGEVPVHRDIFSPYPLIRINVIEHRHALEINARYHSLAFSDGEIHDLLRNCESVILGYCALIA